MQLNKVNEVNTTRVLQQIWMNERTTRVAIAAELGLVKSTVSRIVAMLLEQGIVRETTLSEPSSGVGRNPIRLEINERYGIIIGLEMQTDFYNAVAIDLNGALLRSWSGPISMTGKDTVTAFLEIMTVLDSWVQASAVPLIGVGVAVAGIVDQHDGVIFESNPLNLTVPVRFVDEVGAWAAYPVIVENDANCCCWGELVSRKKSRHDNFLFVLGEFRTGETESDIYWGIAIGLGLVLDGVVYHGATHSAGEFQSILWKPGNEGQLSISNEEARRIKEDRSVMTTALGELCAHVAFLVNTLNLTNVVFGGEITEYSDQLLPLLQSEIQRNWSYPSPVEVSIDFSALNKDAVAYGAAGMFLEGMFSVPNVFVRSGSTKRLDISVIPIR